MADVVTNALERFMALVDEHGSIIGKALWIGEIKRDPEITNEVMFNLKMKWTDGEYWAY